MASPQKEEGFTPIANELFEAFYRCKLLEYERCVVMCIWRKTYGWQKKEDWMSNSQILEETGIALPNITRTIKSLVSKKILTRNGKKVGVNKNYEEWEVEWRKLSHQITKVISPDNKKLSHQIPTKERKKLLKEIGETSSPELKDKNIDMSGFNKYSDEYEEGSIDLDGDGEIKEEKKKSKAKYPNAPTIRKIFQEVLGLSPFSWKTNKTELIACENLYTERTPEKVRNALEFYKENQEDKFCPQITQPSDLDRKWTKLGAYKLSKD
jgi:phage replication O-like protein O